MFILLEKGQCALTNKSTGVYFVIVPDLVLEAS